MASYTRSNFLFYPVREQETDPLVSVLLPHLQHMRHWANALKSRALLRLGKEDIDGFCRDAMAIVRLGRLSTHAPTLSTSRSRLKTAIFVLSPASRAQALIETVLS